MRNLLLIHGLGYRRTTIPDLGFGAHPQRVGLGGAARILSGLHRELSTKTLLSSAVICALMPDEAHQFATTVLGRTSQLA